MAVLWALAVLLAFQRLEDRLLLCLLHKQQAVCIPAIAAAAPVLCSTFVRLASAAAGSQASRGCSKPAKQKLKFQLSGPCLPACVSMLTGARLQPVWEVLLPGAETQLLQELL
jgi:hypothetical protein